MLKLKLQYFGYLMRRADSLEKTLMLSSGCSLLACTEQTPPHASPTTVWNFSGKVSYPTPTTKSQQPSSSQSSWGDKVSRWSPLTTHPHNSWMHPSAPSKCPE